jgi:hypothetical protein
MLTVLTRGCAEARWQGQRPCGCSVRPLSAVWPGGARASVRSLSRTGDCLRVPANNHLPLCRAILVQQWPTL